MEVKELIQNYQSPNYQLHLGFSPLKQDANSFTLQKSTELGIDSITQVITERTVK